MSSAIDLIFLLTANSKIGDPFPLYHLYQLPFKTLVYIPRKRELPRKKLQKKMHPRSENLDMSKLLLMSFRKIIPRKKNDL